MTPEIWEDLLLEKNLAGAFDSNLALANSVVPSAPRAMEFMIELFTPVRAPICVVELFAIHRYQ